MKKFTKLLPVLSIIIVMSIFLTSNAFAMNPDKITKSSIQYADEQIKKQIEKEFFNGYAEGLDSQKKDLGLTDDSFKDSQLGDGIPYSYLSKSFYDQGNDNGIAEFHGYIFPVLVKEKVVATIFAEINNDGQLSIFKVSSINDIGEKVIKAQDSLTDTDTATLVLDERFGLSSLLAKNSDNTQRFIPIKDGPKLNVFEGKSQSPEELYKKIKSDKAKNSNEKGGGGNSNDSLNSIILPALIALAALVLALIIWFRKGFSKKLLS